MKHLLLIIIFIIVSILNSQIFIYNSENIKKIHYNQEEYSIITDIDSLKKMNNLDYYFDIIHSNINYFGFSTFREEADLRYFKADSIETIDYLVVYGEGNEKKIVGLIKIPPNKNQFVTIKYYILVGIFYRYKLKQTISRACLDYTLYGFKGEKMISKRLLTL
jgi:uncharacterized protein YxeA